jgi:hypothetical protein
VAYRWHTAPNTAEESTNSPKTSIAVLPIDYLREIEHASFPLDETDPGKVHCVELLCAVSYLDATVTRGPSQWRARIRRITWMGRVALQAGAG